MAFRESKEERERKRAENNLKNEGRRLQSREHFIVLGIRYYAKYYLLLWIGAVAFVFAFLPALEPVVNYDFTRFFAGSTLTISITTITLALPTALNIILDRYAKYTNRYIINILVQRFPISLLTLSAFTSLIVSMLVASGILGNYFSPTGLSTVAAALLLMIYWAGVCIIYLFIVIEKMVYFVVNAPEAVLEKLEFGVYSALDLSNKEQYAHFRSQLASINDIAATLVEQSTGRDVVIIRCLDALRSIHRLYLAKGIPETDIEKRKLEFKAVHAVDQELVRIYRAAATAKNEHATLSIVNTWCLMVRDAVEAGADNLYIAEMMNKIQRFQSYAETSFVEVIEEQVYTDWYFLLAGQLQDFAGSVMPFTRIASVRELSSALRRITTNNDENLFLHFMRTASNTDLDINLEGLNRIWLGLLDRSILIYLTWLIENEPRDAMVYLNYLRIYSARRSNWMRSVISDTPERIDELLRLSAVAESLESARSERDLSSLRSYTEEMEDVVRTHAVEKPGGHAVSIIDDAEDMNVGRTETVSVVTKLVADQGLPTHTPLDDETRKVVQTQTANITDSDPRLLDSTSAMMGLPVLDGNEEQEPSRVLAYLVFFKNAHISQKDFKGNSRLADQIFEQGERLKGQIGKDAGLAHKVALANRAAGANVLDLIDD